jgi:hypothetical protein
VSDGLQPEGPPADSAGAARPDGVGLAVMRALQARCEALGHEKAALAEQVATLRDLVGRAFAEGFRARVPDHDEPWLADWLLSSARTELAQLARDGTGCGHDQQKQSPSDGGAAHDPRA